MCRAVRMLAGQFYPVWARAVRTPFERRSCVTHNSPSPPRSSAMLRCRPRIWLGCFAGGGRSGGMRVNSSACSHAVLGTRAC